MDTWKIILLVVVVLVVLAVVLVISQYNNLIRSRNQVREAFSTMDILLLKRSDLIPDLVATVKASAAHESETLEAVVSARSKAVSSNDVSSRLEAENELSTKISNLLVIAEAYPDLKASSNFVQMQNDLRAMETEIENSRKYYNGTVKYHNNAVSVFPANIIASMFNFKTEALFELRNEAQREKPKVEF
ncbi:MAG: LemA family protein [Erysipelothrix sp.]|nr:LemA family protein [Erysipelothrix sp.]